MSLYHTITTLRLRIQSMLQAILGSCALCIYIEWLWAKALC